MKVEEIKEKIKELDEMIAVEILAQILAVVFDKDTPPKRYRKRLLKCLKIPINKKTARTA